MDDERRNSTFRMLFQSQVTPDNGGIGPPKLFDGHGLAASAKSLASVSSGNHVVDAVIDLLAGSAGLYAGTIPSLAANIAENSVLFAAYGVCQKGVQYAIRKSSVDELNAFHNACAGFFAAFFSSLTLCPTELIKCRLQAMRETFSAQGLEKPNIGPWSLTRTILKSDGIPGLFRGLTPTFAREMPGYFFFFGGYEVSRGLLTPAGKTKDEIGPLRTIVCGGVGGTCLWTAIFPFDVIKSRIQVAGSRDAMIPLMIKIVKEEGSTALYRGLGPTLLRTFPACGALFVAFEFSKKYMHKFVDDIFL